MTYAEPCGLGKGTGTQQEAVQRPSRPQVWRLPWTGTVRPGWPPSCILSLSGEVQHHPPLKIVYGLRKTNKHTWWIIMWSYWTQANISMASDVLDLLFFSFTIYIFYFSAIIYLDAICLSGLKIQERIQINCKRGNFRIKFFYCIFLANSIKKLLCIIYA